jgi:hypothetical protein
MTAAEGAAMNKKLLFQKCTVRGPLDLCASGPRTRSKPVPSVNSQEKSSKRTKEAWAESRAEARVEASEREAVFEAILEAVETPPAKARIEKPSTKARVEEPAVEAGAEPALEARVDAVRETASEALGVKLAGSPEHHQKG